MAALDHAPEDREVFLAMACGDDTALLAEVRALIASPEAGTACWPADPAVKADAAMDFDATIQANPGNLPPLPVTALADLPTMQMLPPGPQSAEGPTPANPLPQVPYIFGKRIARGGMGAILETEDCKLGRTIAAKVMLLEREADEDMRQRFIQEAAVLAKLAHPNIVPVYDLGHDAAGQLYYTMKLVKGRTLQDILDSLRHEQPGALREFTLERLLTIFRKVADALAFAHSKGIIHRDLKPENVMVGEFGEVLLMDWGLAKIQDKETGRLGDRETSDPTFSPSPGLPVSPSSSVSLTATLQGSVMGTPKYMSPEQAMGLIDELDSRSDIFSLGGILYAILTLRPPVEGKTVEEVLEKVSSARITPPTAFGTTTSGGAQQAKGPVLEANKITPLPHMPVGRVPAALSAVAMKALTLEKTKRYQDVAAFSADIEKYQGGFATTAEEAGLGKQLVLLIRRHKGIFTTAFAAWLLITALAVWFVFNLRAKEQRASKAEAVAVQKEAETSKALTRAALSLAEAALRESNGPAMREALDTVPEELRDSTWRYLLSQADTSIARIDVGSPIQGVVAHPRLPSVFVIVNGAGKVTILNVRTGERSLEFAAGLPTGSHYFNPAISPDGERIAVGHRGPAGGIVMHNARDGKKIIAWEAKPSGQLEFSPDGRFLLQTEPARSTVHLWNATNGQLRWSHDAVAPVTGASFTPDGKELSVRGQGPASRLLRIEDGTVARQFKNQVTYTSALSPDGKAVVGGQRDGTIVGFDLAEDRHVFQFRTDGQEIRRIVFTAAGTRFVSVAVLSDGRQAIRLWDAQTGAPVQSLLGGSGQVDGASAHPLSGELVVCGPETRVWSLGGARWTLRRGGNAKFATLAFWGGDDVVFGPHLNSADAALLRLDGRSSSTLWTPPEVGHNVVDVSADGRFAVVGEMFQKKPVLFLRRNGDAIEQVGSFTPTKPLGRIRISPSGGHLAAISAGWNFVELFDAATGTQPIKLEHPDVKRFNDLRWLSEEHVLVLVTAKAPRGSPEAGEQVVVMDVTSGEILRRATNPSAMDVLAVAPDGRRFAEAGADKNVRIRDTATLAVLNEFRVHDDAVTALAWHPKKPILATGSADLTIRLWNLETGERIDEFRGPLAAPRTLAFSPSGQRLGCASADAVTRIWDPPALRDETAPPLEAGEGVMDEHAWFAKTLPSAPPTPAVNLKTDAKVWTDLLATLTPETVEKTGHGWRLGQGELLSPATRFATVPLPGDLSGASYQVHMKLRRIEGGSVFHIALPVGDRMTGFEMDGRPPGGGIVSSLLMVNGKYGREAPGFVDGRQINDNEPHDLEVTVRPDGANATISVTLDAKPFYEWAGPTTALSQASDWAKGTEPGLLALGSHSAGWAVSEVELKRLGQ